MSGRFHCELAWLGGAGATADVLVTVDGGRITSVESGVATAPAGAVRLAGLTLPGLANGHSHAFHRALRSRTQAGTGSFWTWRSAMYAVADRLDPDSYLRLAAAVYAEMALAGISVVGEFHYLHHGRGGVRYDDPNAMSAALGAAAAEAGIRLTLLDTCYLQGGFGAPLEGPQRRFGDGDADRWAERAAAVPSSDDVVVGAAVHSVRAVDPAAVQVVARWAAERSAPLHAHVSEQPAEHQQSLEVHGRTPMRLLADHGAVSERFTAVHATHADGDDARLLGAAGGSCCCCPTTERDLADGVTPARALRAAGARLTLGSDSHAVVDLFEEARAVELDERLVSNERGHHDAMSLLQAATAHGHASLGRPEGGRLAPGAPADLTTVRLDSVRTAGAGDPLAAAVFAATAADVDHVVVSGRVVVADGRHATMDVPRALAAALAEVWS